jgi:hypothetical protein
MGISHGGSMEEVPRPVEALHPQWRPRLPADVAHAGEAGAALVVVGASGPAVPRAVADEISTIRRRTRATGPETVTDGRSVEHKSAAGREATARARRMLDAGTPAVAARAVVAAGLGGLDRALFSGVGFFFRRHAGSDRAGEVAGMTDIPAGGRATDAVGAEAACTLCIQGTGRCQGALSTASTAVAEKSPLTIAAGEAALPAGLIDADRGCAALARPRYTSARAVAGAGRVLSRLRARARATFGADLESTARSPAITYAVEAAGGHRLLGAVVVWILIFADWQALAFQARLVTGHARPVARAITTDAIHAGGEGACGVGFTPDTIGRQRRWGRRNRTRTTHRRRDRASNRAGSR